MFSDKQLEFMQRTQEQHMMDQCVLLVNESAGQDGLNIPILVPTELGPFQCGLDEAGKSEWIDGSQERVAVATLRLPIGLLEHVRQVTGVRIVNRLGDQLDPPWNFEVIGGARPGPSGLVVPLRRVP